MRVLVVWSYTEPKSYLRNTIRDYVYSFKKYDKKNKYYYLNLPYFASKWSLSWIKEGMFDVILFTNRFLDIRWAGDRWVSMWNLCEEVFGPLSCRKVIMPQDDYDNPAKLWDFVQRVNVDEIFSVLPAIDYEIVYPREKIGNVQLKTILTGYVEEEYISRNYPDKSIDVMYRASKLPYKFGKMGQQKTKLIDVFLPRLSDLNTDIRNTITRADTYLGDAWIEHLAMARCTLGCISGSSVVDIDGELGRGYDEYLAQHPDASYEEAKMACFPNLKENLEGALGPRHLEAAITNTCQVLIRADFSGILRPDIDYIAIDEDYGNVDEVVRKIHDIAYCEEIAKNCYETVVESGNYTYRTLVNDVMGETSEGIMSFSESRMDSFIKRKCEEHNRKTEAFINLREAYGNVRNILGLNK